MLRPLLLSLSQSNLSRRFVTNFPLSRSVASRFVAGEKVWDAIKVAHDLDRQGFKITADHLGENVSSAEEASRAAEAYLTLLDEIAKNGLKSHASLKLTQFGLDLGENICQANLRRVVERAKTINTFVRVDMESTEYTDRTLQLVLALKEDGYDNVGTVIQAYLFRSAADIEALCRAGIRVRLCKGAYQEPPDKAYPEKPAVDANFIKLTEMLLAATKETPDLYPALATHDEKMIDAARQYARLHEISASAFEFQMLYGIRRDLQATLVKEGYNVRVYVPYGTEWYPYFMRRLAERPANLWFFASNFFRR